MKRSLDDLTRQVFDVAVIGGGITGCSIARDAARRGLRVALVERKDFSSGTSAATSKMVHGGLRYLQSLELGVVRESLRERRIWQRIAPHMVRPLTFLLPTRGRGEDWSIRFALALYDTLAFDRNRNVPVRLDGSHHLSARDLARLEPVLDSAIVYAGMSYSDCHVFAPERLAVECLIDATAHGAVVANYVAAQRVTQGTPQVLEATDAITGNALAIRARMIVNAAGPWSDDVARGAGSGAGPRLIRSKGIHVVVRSLTGDHALTVPVGKRHFFVIPWRDHSLIGTTDSPFAGDPDDVGVSQNEILSFLDVINQGLPRAGLTRHDVVSAFAGLRPLVASVRSTGDSYRVSRRAEILEDRPGLVSVIGGKWTTARGIAERSVDLVVKRLGATVNACDTADAPLPGAAAGDSLSKLAAYTALYPGVASESVREMLSMFGAMASDVLGLAAQSPALAAPLSSRAPYPGAAVLHAARHEMAMTLADVVFRRTGIGALGVVEHDTLERCAALMAAELGWSDAESARQVGAVNDCYRRVSMLPAA